RAGRWRGPARHHGAARTGFPNQSRHGRDGHRNAGLAAGAAVSRRGVVPAGLPPIALPPLAPALWIDLLPVAALIAVVSYVESYSIGTTLATRIGTRVDANRELVALGAANLAAGMTGAYPVAGSFSRSSVAFQTGARTQVSALVSAGVILCALLVLMPLVALIPQTVLAAIIMVSVLGIIDTHSARKHWRGHRDESATEIATFLAVIVGGVELELLTGVALALALFVRQSSRPRLIVVGQVGDTGQVRSVRRYEVVTHAKVLAIRIDENIFFANANPIEQRLLTLIGQHPDTRHLVLVCSAVNRVDVTGIEMLARVSRNLAAARIILHLTDVKAQVLRQIEAAELPRALTGQIYFSADQALRALDAAVTSYSNPPAREPSDPEPH
ncbi:MAG: SulP family inorganic anion transporter, partial [Gammaproteobacteria bacterium]